MANAYTVLVVDDEPPIRRFLRASLGAGGHRVVTAEDAAGALATMAAEKPDLIILDLGLPDRSGYELMQEMRDRGVPGIALSGFGMESDVNRARAAGFSEHLTKPINFERLEEVIQQLLSNEVHTR